MKVLLDACVLFPTVQREILLKTARAGAFTPLWSDRILEEWRRAALRHGAVAGAQAEAEIALLRAFWPAASVEPRAKDEARLWLPDENDIHVLAAAIAGSADVLVTENAKDFPRGTLFEEGIRREAPDAFLLSIYHDTPAPVSTAVKETWEVAQRMDGTPHTRRAMLKKCRLPRLAKALDAA